MKDGRLLGIEVKEGNNKPTDDQLYFIDMINKNGGVLGRKLELIVSDNRSDVETTINQYERLINVDKVAQLVDLDYLQVAPVVDEFIAFIDCGCAVLEWISDQVFDLGADLNVDLLPVRDFVKAFIDHVCDIYRAAGRATLLAAQFAVEVSLGYMVDLVNVRPFMTTYRERYPEIGVEIIGNLRFAARSVGCLVSVFVEPLGNIVRAVLYFWVDYCQLIGEVLLEIERPQRDPARIGDPEGLLRAAQVTVSVTFDVVLNRIEIEERLSYDGRIEIMGGSGDRLRKLFDLSWLRWFHVEIGGRPFRLPILVSSFRLDPSDGERHSLHMVSNVL